MNIRILNLAFDVLLLVVDLVFHHYFVYRLLVVSLHQYQHYHVFLALCLLHFSLHLNDRWKFATS